MAHENHELFLRPERSYGIADLCAYARDILRIIGEDPAQTGRIVAHWYSDLANVTLLSETLNRENPTYQANVQDNHEIGHHRVYTITRNEQSVNMFDMNNNPMTVDNPDEMILLMMCYLRTNPSVLEPRMSADGEKRFQAIAANLAIDDALEKGKIDLGRIVLASNMPLGVMYANQARDVAEQQGVIVGDTIYKYSVNDRIIEEELAIRIRQRQLQASQYSLPPAVQE